MIGKSLEWSECSIVYKELGFSLVRWTVGCGGEEWRGVSRLDHVISMWLMWWKCRALGRPFGTMPFPQRLVQFFLWTTIPEKISTMNMLQRKGFYLPNICLLCYCDAESLSHLMIHCPFSWEVVRYSKRIRCFCCFLESFGFTPGMECDCFLGWVKGFGS